MDPRYEPFYLLTHYDLLSLVHHKRVYPIRTRTKQPTTTTTASVRLLIALCRERNLVSQKLVGAIVPVDAILYLLHSNALGPCSNAFVHPS